MGLYLVLNNHYEYEHLIADGEDYYIPERPLPKMEVYLPKLKTKEYEHEQVQDAIRDLVWLNKNCDRAFLIEAIPFNLQLEGDEKEDAIEQINEYIKQYASGGLKPSYLGAWWVITRKGFDGRGKQKILEEKLNTQKISDSINDLKAGVEKITQITVAKHAKLGLRTVKSRWSQFKELVSEINKEIKERSPINNPTRSTSDTQTNRFGDNLDYEIDPTFL